MKQNESEHTLGQTNAADLDLLRILKEYALPLLVAKPVFTDSKITDFEIVFKNEAFSSQLNHICTDCKYYSEMKDNLSGLIDWFDLAVSASAGKTIEPIIYKSEATDRWLRVVIKSAAQGEVIFTLENITNEIATDMKLRDSMYRDFLTGLQNRAKFSEDIAAYIEKADTAHTQLGLLLIDIDNMKNLNDLRGYREGDALLRKAADLLRTFEKNGIACYRFGDDAFMVIMPNMPTLDSLANTTDAIFEALTAQNIPVSGGVAAYPENSGSADDLLRFADIAVHCAKKDGKGRFVFFKPDMQLLFIQKLNMQTKMNEAVYCESFHLEYQPQFDIKSGQLRGFEALIRWHDKELGNISPAVFIPVAEENGLILPISAWVLKTAFSALKKWQQDFNFDGLLSVNISPLHLKQPSFISELSTLLCAYDIKPESIELEITEGIMIDNMDETIAKLMRLKEMGFRISLDDFGTGYSSLSYLQTLPLTTLKIDKSFITNITAKDGVQANITDSIIKMVSKMGLETIAEGVEHPAQLALLKKLDCHIVQGFLRGKPMSEEHCRSYLSGDADALIVEKKE